MGSTHNAKRRDVAAGAREPAQNRQPTDARVLMHHAVARDQRAIADLDPSGEQRPSGDDRRVADAAIMGGMRVLHKEIIVPDDRHLAVLAAAMNRGALTKHIAIANQHFSRTAAVSEVLRLIANDDIGM